MNTQGNQLNTFYTTHARLIIATLGLSALAIVGNMLSLPLFFGVDFIFGSIAVMLAVHLRNTLAVATVAIIGGLYTTYLWGHAYALLIFTTEAVFVAMLYRRGQKNLVLSDLIFWIVLGIPMVFIFYRGIIGMPWEATYLIAFKQPINGVFNALVAGLVMLVWTRITGEARTYTGPNHLSGVLFHIMLTVILLAGAIPIIHEGYKTRTAQETFLEERMRDRALDLASHIKAFGIRGLSSRQDGLDENIGTAGGIALLAADGNVISRHGKITSASDLAMQQEQLRPGLTKWLPSGDMPTMQRWSKGRYQVSVPVDGAGGVTKIILEEPAAPLVNKVRQQSATVFGFLAALTAIGILVARQLSRWLTLPLIRLSRVASDTTNGVVITDLEGRVEWINDGFTRITGYTLDEIRGRKPGDILQGDDTDQETVARVREALASRKGFEADLINYTKNGKRIWLRISCNPLYDDNGALQGFMAIETNITQSKQAAAVAKQEEEFRNALLDSASAGVVACDSQGNLVLFNQTAQQWHGLDALNMPQSEWARYYDLFGADGKTPLEIQEVPLVRAFNGETLEDAEISIMAKGQAPRHVLASGSPFYDDEGNKLGAVVIMRDTTARRDAEIALKRSESRLNAILQNTTEAIVTLNETGVICSFNQAAEKIFGYPANEVLGKSFNILIPARYSSDDGHIIQQFINTKLNDVNETVHVEFEGRRSNGEIFPIELSMSKFISDTQIKFVGSIRDISQRKRDEEGLRQSASVFEHANEGIVITDNEGMVLDANNAFTRITGYHRREVIGRNLNMLQPDSENTAIHDRIWSDILEHGQWSGEVWNRRADGTLYATMQTVSAVLDDNSEIHRYVWLFSDITALKEQQDRLEQMAHYDPLTGLPNRTLLADRLQQAMLQARRQESLIAVVYLDLDGFKAVNDTHGHHKGDTLLKIIAQRLKKALRECDTLARLGGDEFVAVLFDLPDRESSAEILNRMLMTVAEPVNSDGIRLDVSASIGVSFYPQIDPVEPDQLVRQADRAMYEAKQAGKNRFHLFDTDQDQAVRGHHEALKRIHEGLEKSEFVLYYQPKVDMQKGRVIGAEALIRWQHPDRGLLPPGAFLPLMANTSLSVKVGEWVLETAAAQVETWRKMGLALPVSVNIDGYHFAQPKFMDRLIECLARHPQLQPGDIELEVLETAALDDVDRVSEVISACSQIGVGFALDDFGTGYSTLIHLKRLPAQLLKIDRSFVRDMQDDPDDLAILDGIIGLADAFRRETIAEGVETAEHGSMLLSLGCNLAQGYGIACPMPAEKIPAWIKEWHPCPDWTQRTRVNVADLPVLFSIVEHRALIAQLSAGLEADETTFHMDQEQCRFEQWLTEYGRQRYADHPALPRIEQLHHDVHSLARTVLGFLREGKKELARQYFIKIESLCDELLANMDKLLLQTTAARTSSVTYLRPRSYGI